jgi:ABC-type uncharacterized transport system permease subunit
MSRGVYGSSEGRGAYHPTSIGASLSEEHKTLNIGQNATILLSTVAGVLIGFVMRAETSPMERALVLGGAAGAFAGMVTGILNDINTKLEMRDLNPRT